MYNKKVKLRALFLFLSILSAILIIFLVLKSLEENVVYFLSPTEIKNLNETTKERIRVGGMVKKGSVLRSNNNLKISFKIYDLEQQINVMYEGILPDLFAEGQGVVMTGRLINSNTFIADEVLAKHDENYMPPEVADMMKDANGELYKK